MMIDLSSILNGGAGGSACLNRLIISAFGAFNSRQKRDFQQSTQRFLVIGGIFDGNEETPQDKGDCTHRQGCRHSPNLPDHSQKRIPQNTACWKEGGRRRMRCFACLDEAKMVAEQISVRLTNNWSIGDEVTRRDIEILRYCEGLVRKQGVELVAAVEEWVSARKTAGPIPLADAVRFYAVNRTDLMPSKTMAQVADEFVESLQSKGVSSQYVSSARLHLKGVTAKLNSPISDITVAGINC